jgi:spore coat protein U domain-containing protein, fimbrial subunit CupE1/2/3/6
MERGFAMRGLTLLALGTVSLLLSILAQADSCNVTASGGFGFGNYDAFNVSPTDATATNLIALSCNGNGSATINLSTGGSGSYFPRTMTDGIENLNYNLYTSASLTTVWGDGTGGTGNMAMSYHGSTSGSFSVYGRIPAQQNVTPNVYSDAIIVTVLY